MKNDIKTLYKYIMSMYQSSNRDWYNSYVEIIKKIGSIRERLNQGIEFNDKLMQDLELGSIDNFFKNILFPNKGNGVSSNGQSTYSYEMHTKAIGDEKFKNFIKNIIQDPSIENYEKFKVYWQEIFPQVNRVQINRLFAACNTNLSSTVNEGNFSTVFDWLQKHKYIDVYQGDNNWYAKNIFLMSSSNESFKEELNAKKLSDEALNVSLDIDGQWVSIFIWLIYENIANPFSLKKQIVKYGAPGTGKTFQAKRSAKLQYDIWKNTYGKNTPISFDEVCQFVQFHPSFSYEDFIEGIRPVLKSGESNLQLQNGIFKQLCKNAGKWELDLYEWKFIKEWDEITVQDINEIKEEKESHWKIIEGLPLDVKISDVVPPYFMLIDEINRAELSRVFGELMYCLEYRGIDGVIKTQYAEMNDYVNGMLKTDGGYKFFVPHNVFIIASMNTIDRSVDSFDFALRRRFKWEEVSTDINLLRNHIQKNYKNDWGKLADNLANLNKKINEEPILGKDYCIGHAYLWNLPYSNETSLTEVRKLLWDDSIGSLLEEYLRGTGKENIISDLKKAFGII